MWQKIVIVIGIWYDDGFGFSDLDRIMFWAKFSDLDRIMFWAKFSDQGRIRILLKFFGADRIIKFQYLHNTDRLWQIVIEIKPTSWYCPEPYPFFSTMTIQIQSWYEKIASILKDIQSWSCPCSPLAYSPSPLEVFGLWFF